MFDHLTTYQWHREKVSALAVVSGAVTNSLGLLGAWLGVAIVIGSLLGVGAALTRSKAAATVIMLLSTLGTSMPSFLLAMFFWIINIQYYRTTGNHGLPSAGFGWDGHMIMPMIVLAMRPMAQIAQVTYVTLVDILKQDYVRTAHAKGLPARVVQNRHALRNVLIPILTTVRTSLRFSLARLPVVELFFEWPGIGLTLIDAIRLGEDALVVDLILSLGLFFL